MDFYFVVLQMSIIIKEFAAYVTFLIFCAFMNQTFGSMSLQLYFFRKMFLFFMNIICIVHKQNRFFFKGLIACITIEFFCAFMIQPFGMSLQLYFFRRMFSFFMNVICIVHEQNRFFFKGLIAFITIEFFCAFMNQPFGMSLQLYFFRKMFLVFFSFMNIICIVHEQNRFCFKGFITCITIEFWFIFTTKFLNLPFKNIIFFAIINFVRCIIII